MEPDDVTESSHNKITFHLCSDAESVAITRSYIISPGSLPQARKNKMVEGERARETSAMTSDVGGMMIVLLLFLQKQNLGIISLNHFMGPVDDHVTAK